MFQEDIDLKKDLENVKKFDLSGYEQIKTIGSGNYGNAFLYQKGSNKIVVKEFKNVQNFDKLELIKREIINQSECNKENLIVPFLGISFVDLEGKPLQLPLLVMEYEESGSLKNLDKSKLDDIQKMIIIYGIAKGIQFLHHIPICHRDLNPNNIVLDSNKYPLICDFGASRQFLPSLIDDGTQRGTPLYMSPEMIKNGEITTEVLLPSDIFSFGVVIYNLLTNVTPYSVEIKHLRLASLQNFLNSGKRLRLPDSIPSWFRCLINLCWKQNPDERPTIDDIVNLFNAGIALPQVYDETKSAKYFEYLNEHLHLNIEEMNQNNLESWHDRLLKDNKKELALVVDFILADFFDNPKSQSIIGYFYFNGIMVDTNIKKAVDYFNKAAEKEDPMALFYLSEIYKLGLQEIKIDANLSESNRFLNLSASHEFKPAVDLQGINSEFSEISKDNIPTVAVFGDKKVGKTSFINRIINKNFNNPLLFPTASIKDYYFPVCMNNNEKTFICIKDTSGFDSIQNDDLHSIFNDNLKIVILMFDKTNRNSFDAIDRLFNIIQSQKKTKVMIIGNKMDSDQCVVTYSNLKEKAKSLNADYFYETSALKSNNIEMISDEIVSCIDYLNKSDAHEQVNIKHFNSGKPTIKTIIVGSSGCGKTSFLYYLANKGIYDGQTTPGPYNSEINLDLFTLDIWDTLGQERFRSILGAFIRSQNLFIIMFDITIASSFHDIDNFYQLIINNCRASYFKLLIFGNKTDLNDRREVSYDEAAAKARSLNASYLEISCQNGYNFDIALHLIAEANNYLEENSTEQDNFRSVDISQERNYPSKKCCGK